MCYKCFFLPIIFSLGIISVVLICIFCKKQYIINRGHSEEINEFNDLEDLSQNINQLENSDNSQNLNQNINSLEVSVPYITYKLNNKNDTENECAICFDTMNNTKVIQLNCLHKYHKLCLQDWWSSGFSNNQNNCPICGENKIGIV